MLAARPLAQVGNLRGGPAADAKLLAMNSQEETLIRALIAMIQADGEISTQETGVLGEVLTSLDLDSEDIATAGKWLTQPQEVTPEQLRAAFDDPGARETVGSVLTQLAEADSNFDPKEKALLGRLSSALTEA